MKPFRPVSQYLGLSAEDRAERRKLADVRQKAEMIESSGALKPEFRAPEHLIRFVHLETECRYSHAYASDDRARSEDHEITTARVAQTVWNQAFTAGVAHALSTMSTRYLVVTAEEKAAFIAKAEQEEGK